MNIAPRFVWRLGERQDERLSGTRPRYTGSEQQPRIPPQLPPETVIGLGRGRVTLPGRTHARTHTRTHAWGLLFHARRAHLVRACVLQGDANSHQGAAPRPPPSPFHRKLFFPGKSLGKWQQLVRGHEPVCGGGNKLCVRDTHWAGQGVPEFEGRWACRRCGGRGRRLAEAEWCGRQGDNTPAGPAGGRRRKIVPKFLVSSPSVPRCRL